MGLQLRGVDGPWGLAVRKQTFISTFHCMKNTQFLCKVVDFALGFFN